MGIEFAKDGKAQKMIQPNRWIWIPFWAHQLTKIGIVCVSMWWEDLITLTLNEFFVYLDIIHIVSETNRQQIFDLCVLSTEHWTANPKKDNTN
jgi:hypothetical protein